MVRVTYLDGCLKKFYYCYDVAVLCWWKTDKFDDDTLNDRDVAMIFVRTLVIDRRMCLIVLHGR